MSHPKFSFSNIEQPFGCFSWQARKGQSEIQFGRPQPFVVTRALLMFPMLAAAGDALRNTSTLIYDMNDAGPDQHLSMCGENEQVNLIPDCEFIQTHGYEEARQTFKTIPSWQDRSDVPYWRGSLTGHRDGPTCLDMPRSRLCIKGRDLGYDFKITSLMQTEHAENARIFAARINGPHDPWTNLPRHQYHIDIDGNSSAWAGLFLKLLSGGVVLKVASSYKQWYYDRLVPWKNYVPISPDFSDMSDAIECLRASPSLASQIGANGRLLALKLSYASQIQYSIETIRKFDADQKPSKPSFAKRPSILNFLSKSRA